MVVVVPIHTAGEAASEKTNSMSQFSSRASNVGVVLYVNLLLLLMCCTL